MKTWELMEMPSTGLEFLPWHDWCGYQSDVRVEPQECSRRHNSQTERSLVQSQRLYAEAVKLRSPWEPAVLLEPWPRGLGRPAL